MEMILSTPTNNIATKHSISVLIVARSDRMREGLKLVLQCKPWIKLVGQADKSASALEMVSQYRPAVVILDTNLSNNGTWMTVLKQVKAESPQTRCLVLIDTTRKLQAAKSAGADVALLKGFPAAELFESIEGLLPSVNRQ
jgi:two-component system response regulator NreC